jgi:hypothetical protein
MSVILDPLIENPDGYQIAYIKKVLNKIKTSDDGLMSAAVASFSNQTAPTVNKQAYQNLYLTNKVNFIFFKFYQNKKIMININLEIMFYLRNIFISFTFQIIQLFNS